VVFEGLLGDVLDVLLVAPVLEVRGLDLLLQVDLLLLDLLLVVIAHPPLVPRLHLHVLGLVLPLLDLGPIDGLVGGLGVEVALHGGLFELEEVVVAVGDAPLVLAAALPRDPLDLLELLLERLLLLHGLQLFRPLDLAGGMLQGLRHPLLPLLVQLLLMPLVLLGDLQLQVISQI